MKRKLSYTSIPSSMTKALAEVARFGNIKYNGRTFKDIFDEAGNFDSTKRDRLDACFRHLMELKDICDEGNLKYGALDEESGLPHIWHAMYNLGMVITMEDIEKEIKKVEYEYIYKPF